MTVNEFVKSLLETGDDDFRNVAQVKIVGSIDMCDDGIFRFEHKPERFDVKVGVNAVNIVCE